MEELVQAARVSPARVGNVLGRYPWVLVSLARQGDQRGKELLTLVWDQLDEEARRLLEAHMARLVVKIARALTITPGIALGEPRPAAYRFHSDDIDIDATLERAPVRRALQYEDIVVLERRKRRRNHVMMLDCSGSMKGSKSVWAALATASLAMALGPDDQYAVVIFTSEADVLLPLGRHPSPEVIVKELLGLRPEGCTDIALGLEVGLKELGNANGKKVGILLTDGWRNVGGDPISIARRFPQLHVVGLPGGDATHCHRLALAGRGQHAPVHGLEQIPAALRRCVVS